jgi:hypothetical protein
MYPNSPSVSTESPTLHDQHTDAAVRLAGLPDESRQEPEERGEELTPEEVDYLATRDHAHGTRSACTGSRARAFPSPTRPPPATRGRGRRRGGAVGRRAAGP